MSFKISFIHLGLAVVALISVKGIAQEVLTVPKALRKRCEETKDATSCYELGMFYYQTTTPEQIALGKRFLKQGCQEEMGRECTLKESLKHARVAEKARKALDAANQKKKVEVTEGEMSKQELACWNGSAKACDKEGTYQFYLAVPLNPKKGKMLFEEGCRLGSKPSCDTLKLINKGVTKVFDVELE